MITRFIIFDLSFALAKGANCLSLNDQTERVQEENYKYYGFMSSKRVMKVKSTVPQVGTREWLIDPSSWYDFMRCNAPITFTEQAGSWWVFKYPDVEHVLTQF